MSQLSLRTMSEALKRTLSDSFEVVACMSGRTSVDSVRDQRVQQRIRAVDVSVSVHRSVRIVSRMNVLPHASPAPVQEENEGASEYDVRDDREAVRDCHEPLIG